MQSRGETEALLATQGLNTMRFKAFCFESRDADSPYHACMDRFEKAMNGSVPDLPAVLPDVEKAFNEWRNHE